MNEWWQAILTFVVGVAVGVVSTLLFRRGFSGRAGERADEVGRIIGELGDSIDETEERAGQSVELVGDVADTGRGIGESVGRLTEGADSVEDAVRDSRKSVERLKELIRRERERIEQTQSEERSADSRD